MMSDSREPAIRSPGENVKAVVTTKQVLQLALEVFGLRVIKLNKLDGYDDLNFHVAESKLDDVIPEDKEEPEYVNPYIGNIRDAGYVLKIINTHDSARPAAFDMQFAAMFHLQQRALLCPEPVKTIDGAYYELKTLHIEDENGNRKTDEERIHLVYMLTYLRGELLINHPNWTVDVFQDVGQFGGQVCAALKTFDHEYLTEEARSTFDIRNFSHLRKYFFAMKNPETRTLVSNVVDAFEKNAVPHFRKLQGGVVHNDMDPRNILFYMQGDRRIIGKIIDFGDIGRSFIIQEAAVMLADFMNLDPSDNFLWTGGKVLQGFRTKIAFNRTELRLLPYFVMARYVTVIVMAHHSLSVEPANAIYLLRTSAVRLHHLKAMWHTPAEELYRAWQIRTS